MDLVKVVTGPKALRIDHLFNIVQCFVSSSTFDHRVWKTGLPVRSAVLKPHAGWLVVGWVTTSESQLLYVFDFLIGLLSFCSS